MYQSTDVSQPDQIQDMERCQWLLDFKGILLVTPGTSLDVARCAPHSGVMGKAEQESPRLQNL